MTHPVSLQHVLTNTSTVEKIQQHNYTQADGQQKHLTAKLQREKRLQEQQTAAIDRSDQVIIHRESEKDKQPPPRQPKTKPEKTQGKDTPEKPEEPEEPEEPKDLEQSEQSEQSEESEESEESEQSENQGLEPTPRIDILI